MKTFCMAALCVGMVGAKNLAYDTPDNVASRAATTLHGNAADNAATNHYKASSMSHMLKCYDERNLSACKELCEATQDTDACTIVTQEQMAACPKGMARKVPGQACQTCNSDADMKKYFGCGYTCSKIACEHASHSCPTQAAWEKLVADHKHLPWMKHMMGDNTNIAATACSTQKSTRATFPSQSAHENYDQNVETVCTGGHACKAVDAGKCVCAPTTMQ